LAVVFVAGWGSYLSLRSAILGPAWARDHLAVARRIGTAGVVLGAVVTAALRPVWVGIALLYVGAAVLLMIVMVRRSLVRLAEAGGLDALPYERRLAIVTRARRMFGVTGAVLAVVGLAGVAAGAGVPGWIIGALGVTLVATARTISTGEVVGGERPPS